MRWVAALVALSILIMGAEAKRIKTPRSANARAFGQSHKSKGRHAGQKVKVRKHRERYN